MGTNCSGYVWCVGIMYLKAGIIDGTNCSGYVWCVGIMCLKADIIDGH